MPLEFSWSLGLGDALNAAIAGLALAVAFFQLVRSRRRPDDEVVLGWQLRSEPVLVDGQRVKAVRKWSTDIEDPYVFKLVVVNVGRRDIEIDGQFPALDERRTRLFSIELLGCERTTFVRVLAEDVRPDGGGGENRNRWDCVPFHLSVGQALVVEGVTSGRPRSAAFHNMRHARYLRRLGRLERVVGTVLPLLATGFGAWLTTLTQGRGVSLWTPAVAGVAALGIVGLVWKRVYATDRERVWWTRAWSRPRVDIPAEIPRPPEGVSLSYAIRTGTYARGSRSLLIENNGLTSALAVEVAVEGVVAESGIALEPSGPIDIDPGCGLELRFAEWLDETESVGLLVRWLEENEHREASVEVRAT